MILVIDQMSVCIRGDGSGAACNLKVSEELQSNTYRREHQEQIYGQVVA